MKTGVAVGPERAELTRKAGFDFIEMRAVDLSVPDKPDGEFDAVMKRLGGLECPVHSLNCYVPGRIKTTGPEVDFDRLKGYAEVTMKRASRAGVRTIVFGSGDSRRVPDGFDAGKAWAQLLEFGRILADCAERFKVTVAVEPLNGCNIIPTVETGARYVREIDRKPVRLLVDNLVGSSDAGTGSGPGRRTDR